MAWIKTTLNKANTAHSAQSLVIQVVGLWRRTQAIIMWKYAMPTWVYMTLVLWQTVSPINTNIYPSCQLLCKLFADCSALKHLKMYHIFKKFRVYRNGKTDKTCRFHEVSGGDVREMFKSQQSHFQIGIWQNKTRKQLEKKKKEVKKKKITSKKKDLNAKILRENWWSTQIFFKDDHVYNIIPKVKCEISASNTIK